MKQPHGFIDSKCPQHVFKLIKSLNRLKQAPKAWNSKFIGVLPSLGFTVSQFDTSLFVKSDRDDIIILLLYADIILTSSNKSKVQLIITQLEE